MFAIFETGNKQYKVSQNDNFFAEKIEGKQGDKITFDKVLMIDSEIGNPYLAKAKVVCEIVKQGKKEKLLIIKHISQKHHTKKQGHRQPYTKLVVKEIIHG
ncbi:MAG: 50S ribosomal protein L21 [Mycoplasmataceae bacterium]|jgi:large subunit ribosomal protein L21|nr:50S ribosomal protein L21 [Mycoplasmataceae bacterium]